MSIKSGLEKVLKEYLIVKEIEQFAKNPLANFIRGELADTIKVACGDPEKYIIKGSAGQSQWVRGPWVGIFNPIITSSAQKGYYPVYLFREDMKGVYLSLNQAMTEAKAIYKSDAKTALKARSENFRALLGSDTNIFKENLINLAPSSQSNDTAFYEAGNIKAKYYPRDSIPSDDILIEDLQIVLSLYDDLLTGETASEAETMIEGDEPENIHFEDATKFRLHKKIERNAKLAKEAKKIHGYSCQVCGLNFEEKYGEIGKGYIEAHHLEPISKLKGKKVARDPAKDFAVLCANCHRMIHRTSFIGDIDKFITHHQNKDFI
jgi:5-methylcytosine-specific restriction enzyme A